MYIPFTMTKNKTVSIFLDGNCHTVTASNPQYNIIVDALKVGDAETIKKVINIKQAVVDESTGNITLENGVLLYNGNKVNHAVVDRIVNMLNDGFNVKPFMLFLDNLYQNPSYRAVNELYGFLEACNLPITDDGCFVAYKIVGSDYMSKYGGDNPNIKTFDNSVGKVCKMPRNEVDEDPNVTCSSGLHVCSQEYLPHYGSGLNGDDRIMIVKVNPKDVVAVPTDYKNSKMRVCEYVVIDELEKGKFITPDYKPENESLNFVGNNDDDNDDDDYYDDDYYDEDEDEYGYGYDDDDDDSDYYGDEDEDDEDDSDDEDFFEDEDEAEDFEEVVIPTGEVNSKKLTYQDVWDVHSMLEDNATIKGISEVVGVSERQVSRMRDGKAHGHVKADYAKFKQLRDSRKSQR